MNSYAQGRADAGTDVSLPSVVHASVSATHAKFDRRASAAGSRVRMLQDRARVAVTGT